MAEEYQKYVAAEKEVCKLFILQWKSALESDIAPYIVTEEPSQLNHEEKIRIKNENKELRLLVKIDRIKVRNVGNNPNLFCKFRFADETPVKVSSAYIRILPF